MSRIFSHHLLLILAALTSQVRGGAPTTTPAPSCNSGVYINKVTSWNKGYVAKLYLDQSWLSNPTTDWTLDIAFKNTIKEFKVWDADIVDPSTSNNYVMNVNRVKVVNKCWNPILYQCQYLEIQFLVRFPDGVDAEGTTDYDPISIQEEVTYNDGTDGLITYCAPSLGPPTTPAGPATTP